MHTGLHRDLPESRRCQSFVVVHHDAQFWGLVEGYEGINLRGGGGAPSSGKTSMGEARSAKSGTDSRFALTWVSRQREKRAPRALLLGIAPRGPEPNVHACNKPLPLAQRAGCRGSGLIPVYTGRLRCSLSPCLARSPPPGNPAPVNVSRLTLAPRLPLTISHASSSHRQSHRRKSHY